MRHARFVLLTLIIFTGRLIAAPRQDIAQTYDKFKNTTTVSTPEMYEKSPLRQDPWMVSMTLSFSYSGQAATGSPSEVVTTIKTMSKENYVFASQKDSLTANMACDRERTSLQEQSYEGKFVQGQTIRAGAYGMETVEDDNYVETMVFSMSPDWLFKLAHSQDAGIEIVNCPIQFDSKTIALAQKLYLAAHFRAATPVIAVAPPSDDNTNAHATTAPTVDPTLIAAYQAAKDKCLKALAATQAYKDAVQAVADAQKARDDASSSDIPDAAQKLIQAKAALNQMRQDALDADDAVQNAKKSLPAGTE